jgi:hypothetical protein
MTDEAPTFLIALDIEATGKWAVWNKKLGVQDEILSVGFAVYDARKVAKPIKTVLINHVLGKPDDVSWPDYWSARKFEKRCFDEFWSKNIEQLETTQTGDATFVAHSRAELATLLNQAATEFESDYGQKPSTFRYVSDTAEYDRYWLAALMQSEGYDSLAYWRNGVFRWSVNDLNSASYELGRAGAITKNDNNGSAKRYIEDARASLDHLGTQHTHRADQDAADIGRNVLAAMHYKRQRTEDTVAPTSAS